MKEFESSDRKEIEAELLRLMRNPKCYAISTFGAERGFKATMRRVRLIRRRSYRLWVSEYERYDTYWHYSPNRHMKPSCFSKNGDRLAPKFAEHIAFHAAEHSEREPTIIIGWFA